jgi:hypothetical protein
VSQTQPLLYHGNPAENAQSADLIDSTNATNLAQLPPRNGESYQGARTANTSEIAPVIFEDQVSSTDVLDLITRAKSKVVNYIPKSNRAPAAETFCSLLSAVTKQPSNLDAWKSLFLFSYMCLKLPLRGAKKQKVENFIESNIKKFRQNIQAPEEIVLNRVKTAKKTAVSDDKLIKKVCQKIEDGNIKCALRLISQESSIAPDNNDTLSALKDKHPAATTSTHNIVDPMTAADFVDPDEILHALKTFPKGSSGGLDGLNPQHLQDMFVNVVESSTKTANLRILTDFINILLTQPIPNAVRPIFFGARLIALNKPGGGVRPIAVGGSLRRICSKVVNKSATKELQDSFMPQQFGAGMKCGTEIVVHQVRNFKKRNPTAAMLKIDFSNAFNCVKRKVLLQRVANLLPWAFRYAENSYGGDSFLLNNAHVINSAEGIQQGDALGPLLFCLALHPVTKLLRCPLNLWYMDDGIIGGDAETVLDDFLKIKEAARDIGLEVNEKKCEIYNCRKDLKPNDVKEIDDESFVFLGAAITAEASNICLLDKKHRLSDLLNKISVLPTHFSYTLLRFCLGSQNLISFLRCTPSAGLSILGELDNIIRKSLCQILNVDLSDTQWLQASLPIKSGGFGIRDVQSLSVPAYISSILASENLFPGCIDQDILSTYMDLWQNLSSKDLCSESHRQKSWDNPICLARLNNIIQSAQPNDRARLVSASAPMSGDWLKIMPNRTLGHFLSDDQFRLASCLRLGAPAYQPHSCPCGAENDMFGQHVFVCKLNKEKILRHTMLNDVISRALTSAGYPTAPEPAYIAEHARPDGITKIPFQSGKSMAWDVTIPHPMSSSYLHIAHVQSAVANSAENKKLTKYGDTLQEFNFVPIAVETVGAFGESALKIINEIGRRIKQRTGDMKSTSQLRQRVSLAIQKGNAAVFNFAL